MTTPSPAKTDAKPRWERRKDARPHELLAAALTLFVERGYASTRLEDVANKAGVSKGTLYLYFDNKEDLFKAVIREHLSPVLNDAQSMIDMYNGPTEHLFRDFVLGWWQRVGDTPLSGITKLMMSEAGNFPEVARFYHEEVIERSQRLLTALLERGIERGEFAPLDLQHAHMVIVAPMLTLMLWKHSFGLCRVETVSSREYLECYLALITKGLLARPETT
jgi:AcrR family transcriptional regulator